MSNEVCGDNRFEIIKKAKQDLLESTNIQTSEDEMQVIDNILFRCWQMGWLEKYEKPKKPHTNADRIRNMTVEELAEFLEGFTVCDHCEYYKNERCAMENPCVHAFAEAMAFKWLQAEVEGDSE